MADFFYSYREGELQKSHYNMLRSILYDILNQKETFFFHFQQEHRKYQALLQKLSHSDLVEWHYESLKKVLSSLQDHPKAERLLLTIDAIDESDDEDRRDILKLLFNLCSNSKCCVVKVFIASRPVAELEHNMSKFHNLIRLQEETALDIKDFALSFLGPDLNFTGDLLYQATSYIVEQAQGVFLWVHLVREELLPYVESGCRKREIFEQLKNLPTGLEDFYEHILRKLAKGSPRDIRDGTRMFQLALFAYRPLSVAEFQHALAIPNDPSVEFIPSHESFEDELIWGIDKRVIHCGGNFLEIKGLRGPSPQTILLGLIYLIYL
jgi:NACHT domain